MEKWFVHPIGKDANYAFMDYLGIGETSSKIRIDQPVVLRNGKTTNMNIVEVSKTEIDVLKASDNHQFEYCVLHQRKHDHPIRVTEIHQHLHQQV
jgi:hypothetical protein